MSLVISLRCPRCGGKLGIDANRPSGFIARWGYRVVCNFCKWRDDLQEAWCENCSQTRHVMNIAEGKACIRCGQTIE
jgi:hypothetical protein